MPNGEWQWTVPSGHRIRAAIDEAGTESVWVGQKLVSRALSGSKADHRGTLDAGNGDHATYRQDAKPVHQMRVTFDQAAATCELLFDGAPVAPTAARPGRPVAGVVARGVHVPSGAVEPDDGPSPKRVVVAVTATLSAFVGIATMVAISRMTGGGGGGVVSPMTMGRERTTTSPNGMVSVSYPAELTEQSVEGAEDRATEVSVARPTASSTADPIGSKIGERVEIAGVPHKIPMQLGPSAVRPMLAKLANESATTHLGASGMELSLGTPRDGTCAGMPGLISEGELTSRLTKGAPPSKVWTCAFMKGDYAYVAFYALPASLAARDEAALRSIVDQAQLRPPQK